MVILYYAWFTNRQCVVDDDLAPHAVEVQLHHVFAVGVDDRLTLRPWPHMVGDDGPFKPVRGWWVADVRAAGDMRTSLHGTTWYYMCMYTPPFCPIAF